MKRLLLLSLLLLTACSSPEKQIEQLDQSIDDLNAQAESIQADIASAEAELAEIESSVPLVSGNVLDGWAVSLGKPENKGRTYTTDGIFSSEAVDTWTTVPVTLKNTSGKRRSSDDAFSLVTSLKLVDSSGKAYDFKTESVLHGDTDLSAPFNPNDGRTIVLLFDTPNSIKPSHLVIESWDEAQGQTIKF